MRIVGAILEKDTTYSYNRLFGINKIPLDFTETEKFTAFLYDGADQVYRKEKTAGEIQCIKGDYSDVAVQSISQNRTTITVTYWSGQVNKLGKPYKDWFVSGNTKSGTYIATRFPVVCKYTHDDDVIYFPAYVKSSPHGISYVVPIFDKEVEDLEFTTLSDLKPVVRNNVGKIANVVSETGKTVVLEMKGGSNIPNTHPSYSPSVFTKRSKRDEVAEEEEMEYVPGSPNLANYGMDEEESSNENDSKSVQSWNSAKELQKKHSDDPRAISPSEAAKYQRINKVDSRGNMYTQYIPSELTHAEKSELVRRVSKIRVTDAPGNGYTTERYYKKNKVVRNRSSISRKDSFN